MGQRYPRLFMPGRIGGMEIRNRLVMAAMGGISGADDDGSATSLTEDYFEARARGGIGLIIVGSCAVDWPLGASGLPRLSLHSQECVPGLRRVTDAIHRHGAKVAIQLQHAGPSHPTALANLQPVAASPLTRPPDHLHEGYWGPRELTVDEIAGIVEQFATAAARALEAGFDGIELHAAHRYLINTFLSPHWNQREDEYGGSLENRARFLLEIVDAIRETTGGEIPLWCKLNGNEPTVDDGINPEIAARTAALLERSGVDAITVSAWPPITPSNPRGYTIDMAKTIKAAIGVPVLAMGRIDADLGEQILARGEADFIAIGRAVAADPELPNKLAAGRALDVVPCVYCNTCNNNPTAEQRRQSTRTRGCTVNPALTREREYEIVPASRPRSVLVVGGGPSGMEAARVAALRGHRVTLYEREHRLGGKLVLAGVVRSENIALIRYQARQLEQLGVEVRLGRALTADDIAKLEPDCAVVAVGAKVSLPRLPGREGTNVLTVADIEAMGAGRLRASKSVRITPRRMLWYAGCNLIRLPEGPRLVGAMMGVRPFGRRIVVVGRQLPGIELAEFLMRKGATVTLVDVNEGAAFGAPPMPVLRQYLEERLRQGDAELHVVQRYEKVTRAGLVAVDQQGARVVFGADTVIFTGEYRPNRDLYDQLGELGLEAHAIGDCGRPYGILEAIDDGARVGRLV